MSTVSWKWTQYFREMLYFCYTPIHRERQTCLLFRLRCHFAFPPPQIHSRSLVHFMRPDCHHIYFAPYLHTIIRKINKFYVIYLPIGNRWHIRQWSQKIIKRKMHNVFDFFFLRRVNIWFEKKICFHVYI